MSDTKSGGKFSELMSKVGEKVTDVAGHVGETIKEKADQGKDFVGDKMREREIAAIERKLGSRLYKAHKRGELDLPASVSQHLAKLDELWENVLNGKEASYTDDKADDLDA